MELTDKFLGGNFKHYGTEVLHEIRNSGTKDWEDGLGDKEGMFNVMCNAFPTVVSFFKSPPGPPTRFPPPGSPPPGSPPPGSTARLQFLGCTSAAQPYKPMFFRRLVVVVVSNLEKCHIFVENNVVTQ